MNAYMPPSRAIQHTYSMKLADIRKMTEGDVPKLIDNNTFFTHSQTFNMVSREADVLEILLDDMYLKRIDFSAHNHQTINVTAFTDCVVSQWSIRGDSVCTTEHNRFELNSKESSLYYKSNAPVEFHSDPVPNGSYVLLATPKERFMQRFYDDNRFLNDFCSEMEKGECMWAGKGIGVTPAMINIINDINNVPYSGQLKKLYLELKMQELMVMQIGAFTSFEKSSSLKLRDKDLIQEVRLFIEDNPETTKSIVELSQMVGINQDKLKKGFKEMFDSTVFGFITEKRMEKAKHLLLDEKMFVNEVADRVGYKHPHHFTAAFKRKFGFLPSELRNL